MIDSVSSEKPARPTRKATWKSAERKTASMLGEGAERVPVTGRTMGSAPDVRHKRWAIENKLRKALPVLLKSAMKQAVASIRGQQLPIIILHETGKRYEDDFVCLRMADFSIINDFLRTHEFDERRNVHPDSVPNQPDLQPPA